MELAIVDIPLFLSLDGIETLLRGVVVTINPTVSTTPDETPDVDGGWVEREREVQLLCGRDSHGGDFDDLECRHVETGGQARDDQKQANKCEEAEVEAEGEMRRRGFRGTGGGYGKRM